MWVFTNFRDKVTRAYAFEHQQNYIFWKLSQWLYLELLCQSYIQRLNWTPAFESSGRNKRSTKHQLTLTDNIIGLADNLSSSSLFYIIAHQIWLEAKIKYTKEEHTDIKIKKIPEWVVLISWISRRWSSVPTSQSCTGSGNAAASCTTVQYFIHTPSLQLTMS